LAHDLIFGTTKKSHARGLEKSDVGTQLDSVREHFKQNPLSYRAKTAVLLAAGLLVFIFSRQQRE
jgi:hypothetical protein